MFCIKGAEVICFVSHLRHECTYVRTCILAFRYIMIFQFFALVTLLVAFKKVNQQQLLMTVPLSLLHCHFISTFYKLLITHTVHTEHGVCLASCSHGIQELAAILKVGTQC